MSEPSSSSTSKNTNFSLYDPKKPLPTIYKKKAAKELKEEPEQVSAHLESLKRWLKSMPHLKCCTGDDFLLAFLCQAKYNHLKAQRRLDNFCTFRTSPIEGCPEWFEPTESRRALLEQWVDMGCYGCLGFSKEGTLVVMAKTEKLDLDKFSIFDMNKMTQVWQDVMIVDPRVQIGGICMVLDMANTKKEKFMKMFDPKISKLSTKYFQDCLPFRFKKLIYLNAPKVFETLFKVYSEWLNEKIKSRVLLLGSDASPAFEAVPGLKELLPESYGGCAKETFEEIVAKQRDMFRTLPDEAERFAISIDESKRPKESRGHFGVYKDLFTDVMGKTGTYVKLNQDDI